MISQLTSIGFAFLQWAAAWLLWDWFMVPAGFPAIGYLQWVAISLIVGILIAKDTDVKAHGEMTTQDHTKAKAGLAGAIAIVLGAMWAVQAAMGGA